MKQKYLPEDMEVHPKRIKPNELEEDEVVDVVGREDEDAVIVDRYQQNRSFLDKLPRELLLMIMRLLDHDGIVSLAEVVGICKPLAVGDATLRLHFEERGTLLGSIAEDQNVWRRVCKNKSLIDYLQVRLHFVRQIPEQRGLHKRDVSTSLIFGEQSEEEKIKCLLKFARQRFDYNASNVLVVVASSSAEGKAMVKALEGAKHEAFFMAAWPCTQVWNRIVNAGRKFFLVVDELNTSFHFRSMTAIIYFKHLKTSMTHNVLHAVNPGSVYLYVDYNDWEQMKLVKELFIDLQWRNDKSKKTARLLYLSRKGLELMERDNGSLA